MKAVAEKFAAVEREIAKRKGDFALFALFEREDAPDRWDLIVSASWSHNPKDAVEYVVDEIKRVLGAEDLVSLSRIVAVAPDAPAVRAINRAIQVKHGAVEVRNSDFFGLPVSHAYFITSQSLAPAA